MKVPFRFVSYMKAAVISKLRTYPFQAHWLLHVSLIVTFKISTLLGTWCTYLLGIVHCLNEQD